MHRLRTPQGVVAGVQARRQRERIAEPAGERHGLVGQGEPAAGVGGVVELEREPGQQPRPQRRLLLAELCQRLLQQRRDLLRHAPELRPASGEPERGASEQSGVAQRPRRRRRRREGGARVRRARALLRGPEGQQELASQPVLRAAGLVARAQRGGVVVRGLLPGQQLVGAPARGEGEVDRALGPRRGGGEREVVRELPEVGFELRAAPVDQRLTDLPVQPRPAQPRRASRTASRARATWAKA